MTKLQECLYQYITDEQFPILQADEEYIEAQRMQNETEKKLSVKLTAEQRELFNQYMDEENHLTNIHLRHIFQETLSIVQDILKFPL